MAAPLYSIQIPSNHPSAISTPTPTSIAGATVANYQPNVPIMQQIPLRITVPTLSEKLQQRQSKEATRSKNSFQLTTDILTRNAAETKAERVFNHDSLIKRKIQENLDHRLSMSDGRPKHGGEFRKANRALETFKEQLYLLPTIDEARAYRLQDDHEAQNRIMKLKQKSLSSLKRIAEFNAPNENTNKNHSTKRRFAPGDIPWNQNNHYGGYFDCMHQMKPATASATSLDDFNAASSANSLNQNHAAGARNSYSSQINIRNEHNQQVVSDERVSQSAHALGDGMLRSNNNASQILVLDRNSAGFKPTSANNLILFQQQLNEEKRIQQAINPRKKQMMNNSNQQNFNNNNHNNSMYSSTMSSNNFQKQQQHNHAKSQTSLSNLPELGSGTHNSLLNGIQSSSTMYSAAGASRQSNSQWINAYHENETFGRPTSDNFDIKLSQTTKGRSFLPFSPTKVYGDHFNKYVSLGIAERELRENRPMEVTTNLVNEPFLIPQQPHQGQRTQGGTQSKRLMI